VSIQTAPMQKIKRLLGILDVKDVSLNARKERFRLIRTKKNRGRGPFFPPKKFRKKKGVGGGLLNQHREGNAALPAAHKGKEK